jgi:hypothetical protein
MTDGPDDGTLMADALQHLMRRVLRRGRVEMERAAGTGRRRLELRQLRKDRDHFWIRLGKTAQQLVLAGEVDHPALRKAMARIDAIEAELDRATHASGLATAEAVDYETDVRESG